jgi:hypothetical protein
MDEELKQHLQGMEDRMAALVIGTVHTEITASEERMKTEINASVEASQTRLLSAFWKWARTSDARYRQSSGLISGFAERVTLVEDRVAELERGKDAA